MREPFRACNVRMIRHPESPCRSFEASSTECPPPSRCGSRSFGLCSTSPSLGRAEDGRRGPAMKKAANRAASRNKRVSYFFFLGATQLPPTHLCPFCEPCVLSMPLIVPILAACASDTTMTLRNESEIAIAKIFISKALPNARCERRDLRARPRHRDTARQGRKGGCDTMRSVHKPTMAPAGFATRSRMKGRRSASGVKNQMTASYDATWSACCRCSGHNSNTDRPRMQRPERRLPDRQACP